MIKVNEKDIPFQPGMTLHKLKEKIKPEADITVYNGFPVNDDIEVKAGDTLPILCHRIYKESAYYPAIARINNIRHFRDLKPGQRLYFPPLA